MSAHATLPIERHFGDARRTGRGVPAAERRWLIGWSVTLYERGRSHHHHVGRWKYCGLSPKGSRTVRSASALPRRHYRQGTQPEHLSQTPGSEAHRSDSARPRAAPVVARTSVRPQIRIWKGAQADHNDTPEPYFGICSPIPPRGYAPCTRHDGYQRYGVMANELDRPMVYQIRINGHLGPKWADWFGGMTITLEDDGETLLTGPVEDQAALHGLLRKVRDLGMPLISAIRVDPP